MARRVQLALCVLVLVAVGAVAVPAAAPPATTEVGAVMDQLSKAFESKDMATFSRIVAHDADMVSFGTDAVERWVGWEGLRAAVEKQFAAQEKVKVAVRDRVVKVSAGGDVAWVTELEDWRGVSGGEPFDLKGMRLTTVLERRRGQWLIVHVHGSMGVAGQAIKY